MSDLGFLPRMIAIKLAHFNVYGDDIPVHIVEGYIREIITDFNENNLEKQKFEEIKQKAWEFYLHRTTYNDNPKAFAGFAWQYAEEFYEFAKEKKKENCAWIKNGDEMRINAKEKEKENVDNK